MLTTAWVGVISQIDDLWRHSEKDNEKEEVYEIQIPYSQYRI